MWILIAFLSIMLVVCIYFIIKGIQDSIRFKKEFSTKISQDKINREGEEYKNIMSSRVAIEFEEKYHFPLSRILLATYRDNKLLNKQILSFRGVVTLGENQTINWQYSTFDVNLVKIEDEMVFIVLPQNDNSYIARGFQSNSLSDSILSEYKEKFATETIETIEKYVIKVDDLDHIEYVQKSRDYTRNASKTSIAIDEALYGTAAALSKATTTTTVNLSYYKFVFNNEYYPVIYAPSDCFTTEQSNIFLQSKLK